MDMSLDHTQCSTAIAQPIPMPISMRTRREHQMACGDLLVCQTTSVCNNPIACTARIILARAFCAYVCSDVIRTAMIELGNFW